jgi:hypothetical protein
LRSTDSIIWTVKFRNGTIKRFKFPIRTTEEGKAVPDGGFRTNGRLDTPDLFTEPASPGLPEIFTLNPKRGEISMPDSETVTVETDLPLRKYYGGSS